MTEEDLIRLLESRHDIQAVADPAKLTTIPTYQAAVATSRDQLADARATLVTHVAHNTNELSETDTERANVQNLLGNAREHYRYYRSRTHDTLLNLAPGTPITPEELTRRERLYDRYFKLNHTELSKKALEKQVEVLDALLTAHETEEELKTLGHGPLLEVAFRPAIAAVQEYHREVREDLMATQTLVAARTDFDRTYRAHIQFIESLLVRQQRESEAGYFIKRRDPTYAARRRTKTPIGQEPEATDIQSEIQQSTETTPA